jgi:hypothetical protein
MKNLEKLEHCSNFAEWFFIIVLDLGLIKIELGSS